MKGSLRKLLTAVLALVFLFSTAMYLGQQWQKSVGNSTYAEALALATSGNGETFRQEGLPAATEAAASEQGLVWVAETPDEADPYIRSLQELDLQALREVNPDVVGWILIPDTPVNYPLMQGQDNDYYLERTWDRQSNSIGSIFLEYLNSRDLTDFNTIIYGHNMKNGSMFASLREYSSQEYWEAHPYVYIGCDSGVYRYEVFSSYLADVDSYTYALGLSRADYRQAFLGNAIQNSSIHTGVEPEHTDRVLTLSTCSGNGYSTRWVVHARLKMILQPLD